MAVNSELSTSVLADFKYQYMSDLFDNFIRMHLNDSGLFLNSVRSKTAKTLFF